MSHTKEPPEGGLTAPSGPLPVAGAIAMYLIARLPRPTEGMTEAQLDRQGITYRAWLQDRRDIYPHTLNGIPRPPAHLIVKLYYFGEN